MAQGVIDTHILMDLAAHHLAQIKLAGFDVEISTDFKKLEQVGADCSYPILPYFDWRKNTFKRHEAFWIGVKRGDVYVGFVAGQLQALGSESLIGYSRRWLEQVFHDYRNGGVKLSEFQDESLTRISGSLVHGGCWYVDKHLRGTDFAEHLGRYFQIFSFIKWPDADYFYVFMEPGSIRSGRSAIVGITDFVEVGIQWDIAPNPTVQDYCLAGFSVTKFRDRLVSQHRKVFGNREA